jgi:hypothetical protein
MMILMSSTQKVMENLIPILIVNCDLKEIGWLKTKRGSDKSEENRV